MFDNWKRERRIRRVLRKLARQRVGIILQPQNILVLELALNRDEKVEADLQTCLMRGWVEVLHEDLPTRKLDEALSLPPTGPLFSHTQTVYRLTEGGWAALNRAHAWTLINTLLAALSAVTALNLIKW